MRWTKFLKNNKPIKIYCNNIFSIIKYLDHHFLNELYSKFYVILLIKLKVFPKFQNIPNMKLHLLNFEINLENGQNSVRFQIILIGYEVKWTAHFEFNIFIKT